MDLVTLRRSEIPWQTPDIFGSHVQNVLLIGQGGFVAADAVILHHASPLIGAILKEQGPNYPEAQKIILPDFTIISILDTLELIYSGCTKPVSKENADQIMEILALLQIDFSKISWLETLSPVKFQAPEPISRTPSPAAIETPDSDNVETIVEVKEEAHEFDGIEFNPPIATSLKECESSSSQIRSQPSILSSESESDSDSSDEEYNPFWGSYIPKRRKFDFRRNVNNSATNSSHMNTNTLALPKPSTYENIRGALLKLQNSTVTTTHFKTIRTLKSVRLERLQMAELQKLKQNNVRSKKIRPKFVNKNYPSYRPTNCTLCGVRIARVANMGRHMERIHPGNVYEKPSGHRRRNFKKYQKTAKKATKFRDSSKAAKAVPMLANANVVVVKGKFDTKAPSDVGAGAGQVENKTSNPPPDIRRKRKKYKRKPSPADLPRNCDLCGNHITFGYNLKRHMRDVHGILMPSTLTTAVPKNSKPDRIGGSNGDKKVNGAIHTKLNGYSSARQELGLNGEKFEPAVNADAQKNSAMNGVEVKPENICISNGGSESHSPVIFSVGPALPIINNFVCKDCGAAFLSIHKLKAHAKLQHSEVAGPEAQNSKGVHKIKTLKRNRHVTAAQRKTEHKYECSYCNFGSRFLSNLNSHLQNVHSMMVKTM